jgi:hypothetical protein
LGTLAALLGIVMGYAQGARAQGATTTVRASVLQAIVVTPVRDLTFGDVFPGVAKTVPVTGGNHGRWDLSGQANASISLTFTLPTNLVSGTNLLPVGTWTGRYNVNPVSGPGTSFTPSATATNTTFSATGRLYVFIGGRVTPAANQAAGFYSAPATLTVAYF